MSDNVIEIRITGAVDSSLSASARTAGDQLASGLKTAESATNNLHFATAGAIEDYFRLGQAAASGSLSSMASTLVNLGKETGVFDVALATMGTEAAIATGGVAFLAGGLGYLVYEEIENERELRNLADSFEASGRAALGSVDGLRSELTYLSQIGGAGREAARSLLQYAAAHPSVDAAILHQAGQLTENFKKLLGDKLGPETVGRLAEALSNLTKDGFDKLQHDLLNLPTDKFEQIRALIGNTGKETQAADLILRAYAASAHQYFHSYGDQVHDILHNLDQLKHGKLDNLISIPDVRQPQRYDPIEIAQYDDALQKALVHTRALEAAQGEAGQAAKNSYEAAYIAANKDIESKHEEIGLQDRLTKAEDNYKRAVKLGDNRGPNSGAAVFTQQVKDAQADLDAYKKRSDEKTLQSYIKSQDAMVAATKIGSQARIDADQREMDQAAQLFGKTSDQYNDLLKKKGDDQRAADEQALRADGHASKEAREQQLRDLQEQAQDYRAGTQERIDADKKWLDAAIADFGKLSTQAHAAQSVVTRDQQEQDRERRDEAARTYEQQAKDANESAQEQIGALEQQRKYFNLTADDEISRATDIEKERHRLALSALLDALDAANGEKSIIDRVDQEIEDERRNHQKRLAEITRQGLDEQVQDWQRYNQLITSAEDELVGDIFSASQSLWTSLRQVGLHFLQQMIADDIKVWTERKLLAAEGVAAENAVEHGGFINLFRLLGQKTAANEVSWTTQTGQVISGQAAQTAAVATGTAAQTAIKQAGAAESNAAEAESDSTSILNSAYTAAASAFKWVMREVPFPLNAVLAPVAAGAAFTAVAAYDVITAEGGLERVGNAEQFMITHRDESVLPARVSVPLMSFVGDLPAISDVVRRSGNLQSIADVGSLLPVMSPGASVRAAQRAQAPQSDADYVASRVGGGGRASASPSPAPSKARGGDIHIHAWDASSMNQFFRKPSNRRTMDQISKDRVRAGFLPG